MFPFASQASQLRAYQKDVVFAQSLTQNLRELAAPLSGNFAARNEEQIQFLGKAIYFALTTGSGIRTLGEEYCELWRIIPDGKDSWSLPGRKYRAKLFILQLCIPYLFTSLKRLRQPKNILLRQVWKIYMQLKKLEGLNIMPIFTHTHWAVWCLTGTYLHFSLRLLRMRMIVQSKESVPKIQFAFLGLLIFIQLFIRLILFIATVLSKLFLKAKESSRTPARVTQDDRAPAPTCPLCLDPRDAPTATACGHVFCWHCVAEAVTKEERCPLCRQKVTLQELLRLQQFL